MGVMLGCSTAYSLDWGASWRIDSQRDNTLQSLREMKITPGLSCLQERTRARGFPTGNVIAMTVGLKQRKTGSPSSWLKSHLMLLVEHSYRSRGSSLDTCPLWAPLPLCGQQLWSFQLLLPHFPFQFPQGELEGHRPPLPPNTHTLSESDRGKHTKVWLSGFGGPTFSVPWVPCPIKSV